MKLKRRYWLLGLVGVVSLAALAFVVYGGQPGANGHGPPEQGATYPGLPADFQIEPYDAETIFGGQEARFSSLFSEGKPVVVNFFAGLCPPCRAEMPDLQSLSQRYGDRVKLFGLDIGPFVLLGSREDGRRLVEELGVTYPTGTTPDTSVVKDYQVLGMPTTLFMTPDGKVFKKWTGLLTEAKMVGLTEELLAAS